MSTLKGKKVRKLKEGETMVEMPLFFDGNLKLERIIGGKIVKWEVPAKKLLDYVWLLSPDSLPTIKSRKPKKV